MLIDVEKGIFLMKRVHTNPFMAFSFCLAIICVYFSDIRPGLASCGSASCFLAIGNMPSVQPKDLVRIDLNYSYLPMTSPNNRVAAVNVENGKQILDEHFEFQTINQQIALDLNYGVTDNVTLEFFVPVVSREHDHRIEVGVEPDMGANAGAGIFENFDAAGLGDMRLMAKYGFLPTIRSLLVVGLGVAFPTGNFEARNIEGAIQEPTLQVGRGNWGINVHAFQQYELIPHKLNQFLSYTYNHTFENKFAYQFGDTHLLSGGLNWLVTPKITLSGQLNYRYSLQDEFFGTVAQAGQIGNPSETPIRDIPQWVGVSNTGATSLLFTPGLTLSLGANTSWYFYGQAPLVQDYNGGLEPDVSWITGFVHFFSFDGESA